MIAHLNIPAYTRESTYPSSLTPSVVTDLLKDELILKGLTFTDGLNMAGVAARLTSPEVDVEAIKSRKMIFYYCREMLRKE